MWRTLALISRNAHRDVTCYASWRCWAVGTKRSAWWPLEADLDGAFGEDANRVGCWAVCQLHPCRDMAHLYHCINIYFTCICAACLPALLCNIKREQCDAGRGDVATRAMDASQVCISLSGLYLQRYHALQCTTPYLHSLINGLIVLSFREPYFRADLDKVALWVRGMIVQWGLVRWAASCDNCRRAGSRMQAQPQAMPSHSRHHMAMMRYCHM